MHVVAGEGGRRSTKPSQPSFRAYCEQIVANAKALAEAVQAA